MKYRLRVFLLMIAASLLGLSMGASTVAAQNPTVRPAPKPTPMKMEMPTPSLSPMEMQMPTAKPTSSPKPMEMPTPSPSPIEMQMPMPTVQPEPVPSVSPPKELRTLPNLSGKKDFPSPVADNETYSSTLFDLFEYNSKALVWDLVGWRGNDKNRFWYKTEGRQGSRGAGGEVDAQALYGRLIAPYYDFQVGVRYQHQRGRGGNASRLFAVLGLQGLAPYRYDIEPSLFISHRGDVSARFTATKDVLINQRAILQPRIEANAAVQKVEKFGVSSGLNDVSLGLRLRYEIRRELAPYIGVSWSRTFGGSSDLARREGENPSRFSVVSGLRVWF